LKRRTYATSLTSDGTDIQRIAVVKQWSRCRSESFGSLAVSTRIGPRMTEDSRT